MMGQRTRYVTLVMPFPPMAIFAIGASTPCCMTRVKLIQLKGRTPTCVIIWHAWHARVGAFHAASKPCAGRLICLCISTIKGNCVNDCIHIIRLTSLIRCLFAFSHSPTCALTGTHVSAVRWLCLSLPGIDEIHEFIVKMKEAQLLGRSYSGRPFDDDRYNLRA